MRIALRRVRCSAGPSVVEVLGVEARFPGISLPSLLTQRKIGMVPHPRQWKGVRLLSLKSGGKNRGTDDQRDSHSVAADLSAMWC